MVLITNECLPIKYNICNVKTLRTPKKDFNKLTAENILKQSYLILNMKTLRIVTHTYHVQKYKKSIYFCIKTYMVYKHRTQEMKCGVMKQATVNK